MPRQRSHQCIRRYRYDAIGCHIYVVKLRASANEVSNVLEVRGPQSLRKDRPKACCCGGPLVEFQDSLLELWEVSIYDAAVCLTNGKGYFYKLHRVGLQPQWRDYVDRLEKHEILDYLNTFNHQDQGEIWYAKRPSIGHIPWIDPGSFPSSGKSSGRYPLPIEIEPCDEPSETIGWAIEDCRLMLPGL